MYMHARARTVVARTYIATICISHIWKVSPIHFMICIDMLSTEVPVYHYSNYTAGHSFYTLTMVFNTKELGVCSECVIAYHGSN